MLRSRLAVLVLGAALGACAADEPAPTGTPTTRDQLAEGTVLLFDAVGSTATLRADLAIEGHPAADVALGVPVAGGLAYAGIDGDALVVDEVTVNHATVMIPIDVHFSAPALVISDLVVRVHAPTGCAGTLWSDDREVGFCLDTTALATAEWRVTGTMPDVLAGDYARTTVLDLAAMAFPSGEHTELIVWGTTHPVTWAWRDTTITFSLEYVLDGFVDRLPPQ